ncbi:MAG TPA: SagB/ThcOx family dehydrogenase [Beijerinckiaceae bacterium]|jgi:SagB-type dehydrogenase family enzyme
MTDRTGMTAFRTARIIGPGTEPERTRISELFHENTKVRPVPGLEGKPEKPRNLEDLVASSHGAKTYGRSDRVLLPPPAPDRGEAWASTVRNRRTRRDFADEPLGLDELSFVLAFSYGETGEAGIVGTRERMGLRAAPSAGGLYPIEIYVGVRSVEGLEKGFYHYDTQRHGLDVLKLGDRTRRMYDLCCFQEEVLRAGVWLCLAAVFPRVTSKYGERGYRYALFDAGHVGQNVYLGASALGLGVMTSGGFFDDELNAEIGLDGVDESVLYLAFVGRLSPSPASP